LAADGDDLQKLPLAMRKTNPAVGRRPECIFVSDFERGEIGPELFRKACEFGLEGLVSKHRDRAYRAGTSPNWVKVKNPKHPAMQRVKQAFRERSAPAHVLEASAGRASACLAPSPRFNGGMSDIRIDFSSR
jgi:hypothetical protein